MRIDCSEKDDGCLVHTKQLFMRRGTTCISRYHMITCIPATIVPEHALARIKNLTLLKFNLYLLDIDTMKSTCQILARELTFVAPQHHGGLAAPLSFQKLSSIMSVYNPPLISPPNPLHPTIIVLCLWMGASPQSRSVVAIIAQYQAMYPTASIILVTSLPQFFTTTSTSSRRSLVTPVLSALKLYPALERRILVHLFSNGGSVSFTDMCHVYRQQTGTILEIKAIILDSAPGIPGLGSQWEGLSIHLPKSFGWYPSAGYLAFVLGATWVGEKLKMKESFANQTRKWLNDKTLVDSSARRQYIYSVMDRLVGWTFVEAHAREAMQRGIEVKLLKKEKSVHVRHAFDDREGYWGLVKKLWDEVQAGKSKDKVDEIDRGSEPVAILEEEFQKRETLVSGLKSKL